MNSVGFTPVQNTVNAKPANPPKFGNQVQYVQTTNDRYEVTAKEKKQPGIVTKKLMNIGTAVAISAVIIAGSAALLGKSAGVTRKTVKNALTEVYKANSMEIPKGIFGNKKALDGIKPEHLVKARQKGLFEHAAVIEKKLGIKDGIKTNMIQSAIFATVWECVEAVIMAIF